MPIRRVKPADWPAYMTALRRLMPNLISIAQREAYVLEDAQGRVAGTIAVLLRGDGTGYIDALSILDGHEGNGYATDLLAYIKDGAAAIGLTALHADAETQQQRDFLVNRGFTATEVDSGGWHLVYSVS